MPVTVIVGAQWGDEGKAKVIDLLAQNANGIVRYQGGCNAGHTVVCGGETFKFHLIPSGILSPDKTCIIGPGVVIAPEVFKKELESLEERNITTRNLFISNKAHVTLPYHTALDGIREDALGEGKIGTTRRGIGPTYEDKVGRLGLRVGDLLLDVAVLEKKLESIAKQKNPILEKAYDMPALDVTQLLATCLEYKEILLPFIADTDAILETALKENQTLLLEGAQGTMLDLDHGTYPFVTGSNPTAGGACTGSGLGPKAITGIIGIAKAYTTRVGEGPFPTELMDEAGEHLCTVGHEYGTTTGRKRRCGWYDAVAMRYAVQVNSFDALAITKLDVLTGLSEIKMAVAYQDKSGKRYERFPAQIENLADLEPVYETFQGWTEPLEDIRRFEDLPLTARQFLEQLSAQSGVPIAIVSVGPDRDETIWVPDKALQASVFGQALDVALGSC